MTRSDTHPSIKFGGFSSQLERDSAELGTRAAHLIGSENRAEKAQHQAGRPFPSLDQGPGRDSTRRPGPARWGPGQPAAARARRVQPPAQRTPDPDRAIGR